MPHGCSAGAPKGVPGQQCDNVLGRGNPV
jgi:hypothetical protein